MPISEAQVKRQNSSGVSQKYTYTQKKPSNQLGDKICTALGSFRLELDKCLFLKHRSKDKTPQVYHKNILTLSKKTHQIN